MKIVKDGEERTHNRNEARKEERKKENVEIKKGYLISIGIECKYLSLAYIMKVFREELSGRTLSTSFYDRNATLY